MSPKKKNADTPIETLIAESVTALLAYWDTDLVCRYANSAYLSWIGKTQEEVIGKLTMSELLGDSFHDRLPFIKAVLAGEQQEFDSSIQMNGGRKQELAVSYFPHVEDGVVKGFVVHSLDVTAEKALENQVAASNEIISAQNKSLLNFANIVSHNLRSYSGNFENLVALYETEKDETEKAQLFTFLKELAADFRSSVDNLSEIVHIQNLGKVPLQEVNLRSYVTKATEVLRLQITETNATVHNSVSPGIYIEANPAYIESIILNFVSNAIKYRHPDRPPVVELSAMVSGNETVLSIKDNGIGIDLERHRHSLFGMYRTFHGNPDAVGIGLFITKYQVDSMGAHIGVESEVGKGTWFRIYFKTQGYHTDWGN